MFTPSKHGAFGLSIAEKFGKNLVKQQSATGSSVEVNLRAKKAIKPLEASGLIC